MDLHLTKNEFLDLTPYEFSLLLNAYNSKKKSDYVTLQHVIINAGANLMRKKGEKFIELFPEKSELEELDEKEKANRKSEKEALFSEAPK